MLSTPGGGWSGRPCHNRGVEPRRIGYRGRGRSRDGIDHPEGAIGGMVARHASPLRAGSQSPPSGLADFAFERL